MVTDEDKVQDTHNKYTDAYIQILKAYRKQIKASVDKKNALKDNFFTTIKRIMYILTWVFAGTLAISLVLFAIMSVNNYSSVGIVTGAVTTIVSSFATMIISIFQLPQIIAKYLFNKEEDQLMKEIIKNIQQYEIDAVKYEIEKVRLERVKQLNSEVADADMSDVDLTASEYDTPTPSQNADDQQEGTQSQDTSEENNAS